MLLARRTNYFMYNTSKATCSVDINKVCRCGENFVTCEWYILTICTSSHAARRPPTLRIRRDSAAPSRDVAPSASMENLYPPSKQEHYNFATQNPTVHRTDTEHFAAIGAVKTKEHWQFCRKQTLTPEGYSLQFMWRCDSRATKSQR